MFTDNAVHVMLDIETLGTVPGCVIMSIGACVFNDASPTNNTFYTEISQVTADVYWGLKVDPITETWWENQEQNGILERTRNNACEPLDAALHAFSNWFKSLGENVYIWGNGAAFDQPILEYAMRLVGLKTPWKYSNSLCLRTLRNLYPHIKLADEEYTGVAHNALDDAINQSKLASRILNEHNKADRRNKELEQIVIDGLYAVNASYAQADAEWRNHDKSADKHQTTVNAWRKRASEVRNRVIPDTRRV